MATDTCEELLKKAPAQLKKSAQEIVTIIKELEIHKQNNALNEKEVENEYVSRTQTVQAFVFSEIMKIAFNELLRRSERLCKPEDVERLRVHSEDVLKLMKYSLEPSE